MSDVLSTDPELRFACSQCGDCCRAKWAVAVNDTEKQAILALDAEYARLFEPGPMTLWQLKRGPDGGCLALNDQGLCDIHARFGEPAKPLMCQRFPYIEIASDEHVWASASFACRAVRENRGPDLEASRTTLERIFATKIKAADPEAEIWYPVRPEVELQSAQWDQAIEALFESWSDLPAALLSLAAFVECAPEPGNPEERKRIPPDEHLPAVRYAFALTLYADLFDTGSFWSRLSGVVGLPRAMRFAYQYESRMLGGRVDMAEVATHPGWISPDADELLRRWLRSRLRSRQVFRAVPNAAAGMTRLILHTDLALYLARVQALRAGSETLSLEHTQTALWQVESKVSQQLLERSLTRIDPRLEGFWQEPAVARGAAQLMLP